MSEKHRLLVVDNDPLNVKNIQDLLLDSEFSVFIEMNEEAAWNRIENNNDDYDIVLMNWLMPNCNGLAIFRRFKSNQNLARLPVILLTDKGAKTRVTASLEAGVSYFLTYPLNQNELLTVLRSAAEDISLSWRLQNELLREQRCLQQLQFAKFHVQTLEEAQDIGVLLANACPDPSRTMTGFTELLTNAIEHGNLNITYEEKTILKQNDTWRAEINKRLQSENYRARIVTVEFQREHEQISVTITDEGNGFEWKNFIDIDPERLLHTHGRGIALAKLFSFDSIEYLGNGNKVRVCVKNIPALVTSSNPPDGS